MKLWHAYLVFCIASLFASVCWDAYILTSAPFHGWSFMTYTNTIGEGWSEAIAVVLSVPGWLYLFRQLIFRLRHEVSA